MQEAFRAQKTERNEAPILIREAARKARALIEEYAIDPKDFTGSYSDSAIADDIQEVERLEGVFAKSAHKEYADTLEGIIIEHGELSDWFGPYAETIVPSRYDDIKNGVDLILQFNEPEHPERHLALAIDVTFGVHDSGKMHRIKEEIDRNALTNIKYFSVNDSRGTAGLTHVPRVIIGVEKEEITQLAALWIQNDKRALAAHEAQYIILQEIEEQLETGLQYTKEIEADASITQVYEDALRIIDAIYKDKNVEKKVARLENKDMVFNNIEHQLKNIFKLR